MPKLLQFTLRDAVSGRLARGTVIGMVAGEEIEVERLGPTQDTCTIQIVSQEKKIQHRTTYSLQALRALRDYLTVFCDQIADDRSK